MYTAPASAAGGRAQSQARRGLTIYFVAVVLLTAGSDVTLIATRDPVWGLVRMFAPAAASVLARLMLREGFADVSFRLGGRPTRIYIGLALVFPVAIGLIAYGTAWATGLAQFDPHPSGEFGDQLAASLPRLSSVLRPCSHFRRSCWCCPIPYWPPAKRSAGAAICSRG